MRNVLDVSFIATSICIESQSCWRNLFRLSMRVGWEEQDWMLLDKIGWNVVGWLQ